MARKLATSCLLVVAALLALAAALLAVAAASHSELQTVNLTMIDYRFIPDHLIFEHDVHFRLHLENHGKETHELTAPTFFATADIDNPEALNHERTEIVMQPGETKDIFLTAHRPGTYDLLCADHDWAGMVGGITVE
jgi:plastocyanin